MARRITFVIHSLQHGGAERVAALLVNHWAQQGNAVTLITLDETNTDSYAIDPGVSRVALGMMQDSPTSIHAMRINWYRVRCLEQAIRESRPDVVLSFTDKTNVLTLLAARPLPIQVLIAERTDPRRHSIGRIWSLLRKLTYPQCFGLVVQTQSVHDFVRPWLKGRPVYVIPNAVQPCSGMQTGEGDRHPTSCSEPVPFSTGTQRPVRSQSPFQQAPNVLFGASPLFMAGTECPVGSQFPFHIVAMGRLSEEKGFDLLIRAFSQIAAAYPQWCVDILGEGALRATLHQLIAQMGLSGRVNLVGWVSKPAEVLCKASLFVFSSRYEGFPNALLEAMACGLPVVSSDCDSGPREIIRDGIDGILVPPEDVEALAEAMSRLLSDADLRQRMATRAVEVTERFSLDRFFRQWDAVVEGVGEASCRG